MDAPAPVLWAMSVVLAAAAVPCVYRLVRAAGGEPLSCRVNRADEAAELLLCVGMLAMVSPLGGPVPLAGWRAVYFVAVGALAALWIFHRRAATVSCTPSRCGHHAVMAAVMLYMLVGMTQHDGGPWLTLAGHSGSLPLWPLAAAVLAYCVVDVGVAVSRAARAREESGPVLFGTRAREATRVVTGAAMAGMLVTML